MSSQSSSTIDSLVESHMGLARSVARRWYDRAPQSHHDEIESRACWGLWIAAMSYQRDKGMKFTSYAYNKINFMIMDYVRSIRARPEKRKDRSHRPKSIPIESVPEPSIMGQSPFEDDGFENLVGRVPDQTNRELLRLIYRDGYSWIEAGQILHTDSKGRVQRALYRLRTRLVDFTSR